LPANALQRHVRVENLREWCAAPPLPCDAGEQCGASGWAGLGVHREVIRDGLRFTLPGSAPALQWTLTTGNRPGTVHVHCTLNVAAADAVTVAAIERFVADWRAGLESGARRVQQEREMKNAAVCEDCPPWFG
jgi:hypothetical protein